MKDNNFAPRVTQSFDIPPKVRVSLYVVSDNLRYDFEPAVYDNKLLKAIADGPFDKHMRARMMEAKLSGMLRFERIKAAHAIEPIKDFLKYLQVEESIEDTILEARYLVEVTAIEPLSCKMAALKIVQFAAAFLARELEGIILEPYSLKLYNSTDETIDNLLTMDEACPSLLPFLNVVQSQARNKRLLTTTHGLSRFGLPDFTVKEDDITLAEPLSYFIRGLAQSFFESVLLAKDENADRFSLASPLTITPEHLERGNQNNLPQPLGKVAAQEVPLKLNRTNARSSLDLAFRGRSAERSAKLQQLLHGLGLINR